VERKQHWSGAWKDQPETGVSWYQPVPQRSLDLIARAASGRNCRIIDVGCGASLLVDRLLKQGFTRLTVIDIAEQALSKARRRLGRRALQVRWVCEDVTSYRAEQPFDIWHDRACFHFLTEAQERAKYIKGLSRSLAKDGQAIIATFAVAGPERCSGLPVMRYDADRLLRKLGAAFALREQVDEIHLTPRGVEQKFSYFRVQRV
jgi:2-polyprenyl-3-methyl-5-hydroxy-6-metoxy-1,4-benzoquinol methylase